MKVSPTDVNLKVRVVSEVALVMGLLVAVVAGAAVVVGFVVVKFVLCGDSGKTIRRCLVVTKNLLQQRFLETTC